jgi:spore coat polysaccharide biosynthesis protein SpsF (cytidylyltransferase family)
VADLAMKVVMIVQARMGSTRLPGKVMLDVGGQPMVARVLRRARRARLVDDLVLATSTAQDDDVIATFAHDMGVRVFRGSELDVLDRFYRAAQMLGADVVVRVTADCPFIDPAVADTVVEAFLASAPNVSFASNTLERTFPRGLDVEVASFDALSAAWSEATDPHERAHVMPFIYQRPARFQLLNVFSGARHGDLRWTVDTAADLAFARAVYARMGGEDDFPWRAVLPILDREPAIAALNRGVTQKPLTEG